MNRSTRFLAAWGRARVVRNAPIGTRFASLIRASDDEVALPEGVARSTTFTVQSGLHAGACLALVDGTHRIGSDDAYDIVLSDASVRGRRWRLVIDHGGCALFEDRNDGSERRDRSADDGSFVLGDVRVAVREPSAPGEADASTRGAADARRREPSSTRTRVASVGLAFGALAVVGIASSHWIAARAKPDVTTRVARGVQSLSGEGFRSVRFRPDARGSLELTGVVDGIDEQHRLQRWLAASPYADARSTVQRADALVEQVRQAIGDDSLTVAAEGAHLRVEGTTSRTPVHDRIALIAAELHGIVDIDDRVADAVVPRRTGPGPLPVRVKSVLAGDNGWFRTDTGAVYFVGAVMPDGAEVMAIEEKQIRFRLADKIVVYPLG